MSQTLSRMERLARAEEERKRLRQTSAAQESPAPTRMTVPVSESAPLHVQAISEPVPSPINQLRESDTDALSSLLSTSQEFTVAPNATVATEATVAQDATVAPEPSSL